MEKRAGEEMECDDLKKLKGDRKVEHIHWSTIIDLSKQFEIVFPEGFLFARLDDGSDFPFSSIKLPMIRAVDLVQFLGFQNMKTE